MTKHGYIWFHGWMAVDSTGEWYPRTLRVQKRDAQAAMDTMIFLKPVRLARVRFEEVETLEEQVR